MWTWFNSKWGIGLALVLLASPAFAQTKALPPVKLPFTPPALTTESGPKGFESLGKELQKLTKDLVDKAITDVTAASTDATNRNDVIAQPCYDAELNFMKLLPVEWPSPPQEIGPVLAFQVARDLMNAITGNDKGSLKVACAALVGDQLNVLNQLLGMFGVAALAGLPVGM